MRMSTYTYEAMASGGRRVFGPLVVYAQSDAAVLHHASGWIDDPGVVEDYAVIRNASADIVGIVFRPRGEVWSRNRTNEAPSLDDIEFGVRVADAFNGRQNRRHADEYCANVRRWKADELTPRGVR